MSARNAGGKLQHKAYCGKHSLEQKAKVLFVCGHAVIFLIFFCSVS